MRVGFIGIGAMGFAMAARLRDAGWSVAVRDIDAQREASAQALGARVCATPAALAAHVDVVVVAVVDAAQTRDVLFGDHGAAPALAAGAAVMLCPTIAPDDVELIERALSAYGVATLDAPMSGGPLRARAGTMSLMVACAGADFDRHAILLHTLADPVLRVGTRPGDGARTKLVNNLLAAVNLAGAAEAMALATRLGLDPANTLQVIDASSGQSWIGGDRMKRALAGDEAVKARAALLAKDSGLALALAHGVRLDTPVGQAAHAAFLRAVRAGLGEADDAVLYRVALNLGADGSADAP